MFYRPPATATSDAEAVIIKPQPGRQEEFLSTPADIAIYGGAAGGGKTWALLLDPLRDINVPGFRALIFRRTYADVTKPGGLWDEASRIYPLLGARASEKDMEWRFPSGAVVAFGHCQSDGDLYKYDGAQIALLAFDQLEHFSERAFWYLMARNRTTCGVPPRVRATCNPPDPRDEGSDWLPQLLSYWIGDDGYADLSKAGKIVWIARINDELKMAENENVILNEYPGVKTLSMTFIPATVYDNKLLLEKDPNYLSRLQMLQYVERERFLGDAKRGGNWKIRAEAGKVFNSQWFEVVNYVPDGGVECRAWDFAATLRSLRNNDPDYTAGVKMRKVGGYYYVMDVINERYSAGELDDVIALTAERDRKLAEAAGAHYVLRWEVEPGSAGIRETERLKRLLTSKFGTINCDGVPAYGDKVQRAMGFSSAAEQGLVRLVAGRWVDAFLSQLHGFPDKIHDDMVDAASTAFNTLVDYAGQPAKGKMERNNPWLKAR
jgi:predicted phage terminase large subunit-like protein